MSEPAEALECPYAAYRETYGPPNIKWCEERLCGYVEEPANAWSNVAYLAVAAVIAYRYRRRRDASASSDGQMRELALAVAIMGAFSLFYHATNNYFSQVFDFAGMFLYVSLLLSWNLRRLGVGRSRNGNTVVFGALAVGNMLLLKVAPAVGLPIQSIVMWNTLAIVASEALVYLKSRRYGLSAPSGSYPWYALALSLMLAAAICSALDLRRIWCDPTDHFWQGHAAWHVLSALSIYPLARFYRKVLA